MGDFNLGEVVNLKTGLEVISSNSSVVSELELVGGAWELEPEHFADVSQVYLTFKFITDIWKNLLHVDRYKVSAIDRFQMLFQGYIYRFAIYSDK